MSNEISKILDRVQEEVLYWQRYNFPGRSSWMPLMGLGEELGELIEAEGKDDLTDAIGDCGIYIADYCNAMGWNMSSIYIPNIAPFVTTNKFINGKMLLQLYGNMCHSHLKIIQRIRMHEPHQERSKAALSKIIKLLDNICESYGSHFEEIVLSTWLVVRERDWQKNANTAHIQDQVQKEEK